jgi:glycerate dehydrogenase
MERIVFIERNTIQANFRRPAFEHDWVEYPESSGAQVSERIRDATVIISNKLSLGEPQLAAAPDVKLIAIAATGSDCVDLAYCQSRGITVCNVRGYAANSVPEHVLMLILALRRNLLAYRADVREGKWQQSKQFCLLTHPLNDIKGSTIGIIGHGAIGKAMSRLAEAMGLKVLLAEHKHSHDIRPGRSSFVDVLKHSDVVTLHCPLNEDTRDMFGPGEFAMMKPQALLINTARGALIQDEALVNALKSGLIAGAAVDCLRDEPPRNGSALLDLNLPNFIVTPHVAWASEEAVQALADQVIDNIEAFVAGSPRNVLK